MGAPTALATVTVSARCWGRPQHRGRTPEPAKRNKRAGQVGRGFRAIPLAKIVSIRHGKRYENYTVMTTADDLGRRHWTTRGIYVIDGESDHTPRTTLADA